MREENKPVAMEKKQFENPNESVSLAHFGIFRQLRFWCKAKKLKFSLWTFINEVNRFGWEPDDRNQVCNQNTRSINIKMNQNL